MASIQRRPDGRYRARYRDEAGRERSRHFTKKRFAQDWLDQVTSSLVTGTYVNPDAGRLTLRDFYTTWSARQIWASSTRKAMDLAVNSTPFADIPLKNLRRSHAESWVKSMVTGSDQFKRPLAATTVHTRVQNLRTVLRAAVADKVLPRDPSEGVRLPRRRRTEAAMRIPTPAQVGQLLSVADEDFSVYISLCAFAGLRLGEAAGLKVSDIDFLRRTLTVSRQVQRAGGGEVEISAPKWGSERVVYLAPDLVDMISQRVRDQPRQDWLFVGFNGNPPHQNTIGYRWRMTLKRGGMSDFTLRDATSGTSSLAD